MNPSRSVSLVTAALLAAALSLSAFGIWRFVESRTDVGPVRVSLRQQLRPRNLPGYIRDGRNGAERGLLRFYRRRGFRPVWVDARGPLPRAKELSARIAAARYEGLSLSAYNSSTIQRLLRELRRFPVGPGPEPDRLANLDVLLTWSFMNYAADLSAGRVDPGRRLAGWHIRSRRSDWTGVMEAAAVAGGVASTFEKLEPPHADYARLREGYRRYQSILDSGGWPRVPGGSTLRRGSRGTRVALLRKRLALSGDLKASALTAGAFDGSLEQAVRRFQERHGLEPTGTVRARDLAAMNVPVEKRLRQIALNLERWRWLPSDLGERHILINIPDYTLQVVEKGRPKLSMRVVVGKEYSQTPVFSATLTHVVLNPYWTIPASIVKYELPQLVLRDPQYLRRNRMVVFDGPGDGASEVPDERIDWDALFEGSSYTIRQEPGPGNPLGRIKFMLPNRFNVYLHDTPAGHLFSRRERGLSHGCIRLEKPDELARYLLGGRVPSLAAEEERNWNRWIAAPRPIPVHILYWTAWVDSRGMLHFRGDVYGFDRTLTRTLEGGTAGDRT